MNGRSCPGARQWSSLASHGNWAVPRALSDLKPCTAMSKQTAKVSFKEYASDLITLHSEFLKVSSSPQSSVQCFPLLVWLSLTWGVPDRDSDQHLLSPARINPQHLQVLISGLGSFWVFYLEPASFRMNVSSTCPKAYARGPLLKVSYCCCFVFDFCFFF